MSPFALVPIVVFALALAVAAKVLPPGSETSPSVRTWVRIIAAASLLVAVITVVYQVMR